MSRRRNIALAAALVGAATGCNSGNDATGAENAQTGAGDMVAPGDPAMTPPGDAALPGQETNLTSNTGNVAGDANVAQPGTGP